MKKRLLATLTVMALTATTLLLLASTASAAPAQGKSMVVSGNSKPADCNPGKGVGSIALTGDVSGCLTFFPKRFVCKEFNGFARYVEWGTERFKGKLMGKSGRFTTTYKVVGTYEAGSCAEFNAGGFPFEKQITGGCKHNVTGTRGAFKGYGGVITFYDQIPEVGKGATNFLYTGNLKKG